MTLVLLGVVMFTAIVLALVAVMLVAKARLVTSGDVSILVNDEPANTIQCKSGSTLLGTLAAKHLFIPSACGGKGSCGVCKVVVNEGAALAA